MTQINTKAQGHSPTLGRLLFLLCFALSSCGGGTIGTDTGSRETRNTKIMGTVTSPSGEPVPGVECTVIETGDSFVSNEAGLFEIPATFSTSEINLQVMKEAAAGSVIISDIPPGQSTISVSLILNQDTGFVTLSSLIITPIEAEKFDRATEAESTDLLSPEPESRPQSVAPERSIFSGVVRYKDKSPASKVRITLRETGVADTSSSNGRFSFESPVVGGNLTLVVELASLKDTVVLTQIPRRPVHVEIVLELNILDSSPYTDPMRDLAITNPLVPKLEAKLLDIRRH